MLEGKIAIITGGNSGVGAATAVKFAQEGATPREKILKSAEWLKTAIENGIIHQGKFEKYFQCFAKKIMPLIHNQKNMTELFLPKSVEAQKIFYDKTWNNWKFKFLFKLFFISGS